jgi:hypothetical protein
VTVLHAACWLFVSLLGMWVTRESRRMLRNGFVQLYRDTYNLGQSPVVITTLCESCACPSPPSAPIT